MKLRLAFVLFAASAVSIAQDGPAVTLQQFSSVTVFAFGGIGFAGQTSRGEIGFKTIQKQPPAKALADFEKLYSVGNPQAKAYALVGIRRLAPKRFSELRQTISLSAPSVEIEIGCIVTHESLKKFADDLAGGKCDAMLHARGL